MQPAAKTAVSNTRPMICGRVHLMLRTRLALPLPKRRTRPTITSRNESARDNNLLLPRALFQVRCVRLEVKANFCCQRPRSDVVRSAEGGEEVVERVFVAHVHRRKTETPLVLVAVKEIVFANRGVEEIA